MNNGLKPLNKFLDTLNYITLLTNIPSGAYDASKIKNIEVSLAKENEKFIGFNNKEYILTKNDIVVRSNGKIISLAGIIGSKDFGVNSNTKDAYIEFANFNYVNIRKTATRTNTNTDASRRFSKKISNFSCLISANMLKEQFKNVSLTNVNLIKTINKPISINIKHFEE
jgi:phenylalanyl-tRNA synthetase beta chain